MILQSCIVFLAFRISASHFTEPRFNVYMRRRLSVAKEGKTASANLAKLI